MREGGILVPAFLLGFSVGGVFGAVGFFHIAGGIDWALVGFAIGYNLFWLVTEIANRMGESA